MPLRDHFRPPLILRHTWDKLHGMWPAVIVQYLFARLPEGYIAAPNIHLGTAFEVDVTTHFDENRQAAYSDNGGGVATLPWAPPAPTLTLEAEIPKQDEYEVLIYDETRGQTLVAAIEIVSPGNKDRPENRQAFVAKMAALLQQDVCVSIVDLVTVRQFNLYADLLALIGKTDPALGTTPPDVYAATVRYRYRPRRRSRIDSWFYPLTSGQPLPTLPLWLDENVAVALDLESTYEDSCRVLRIS